MDFLKRFFKSSGFDQQGFEKEYPSPHCNPEVLHAPGTCKFCDLYSEKQELRKASNTPFTPAEANGWGGNVAQPEIREG